MKTLASTLVGSWFPATEPAIRAMSSAWEREAAADAAAHEIENLLADSDLLEHCRMALLET